MVELDAYRCNVVGCLDTSYGELGEVGRWDILVVGREGRLSATTPQDTLQMSFTRSRKTSL